MIHVGNMGLSGKNCISSTTIRRTVLIPQLKIVRSRTGGPPLEEDVYYYYLSCTIIIETTAWFGWIIFFSVCFAVYHGELSHWYIPCKANIQLTRIVIFRHRHFLSINALNTLNPIALSMAKFFWIIDQQPRHMSQKEQQRDQILLLFQISFESCSWRQLRSKMELFFLFEIPSSAHFRNLIDCIVNKPL